MSHYTILCEYGKQMCDFFVAFLFSCSLFTIFGGIFNKTIIPLTLVGYEMIIANLALHWLCTLSYPTRACGIIVKYTGTLLFYLIIYWYLVLFTIFLRHFYFLEFCLLFFWGVFNKTIIPLR